MKRFALFLFLVCAANAADVPTLDREVTHLRFDKAALPAALRTLGRACGVTILVEPDVVAEISLEIERGSLRSVLTAMTEPYGFYFREDAGGIVVRKQQTVLYTIDYPQLTRSGSGSASITLGGQNSGYGGYGSYPNGLTQPIPATPLTAANGTAQTTSDATQISVSQENQNTFWANLESELRAMLGEGETLVLNRFSGVAQITASVRRHETIKAFIDLTNRRITQQVEIEARLVEVTLRDEKKLGVDWDLATATVGGLSLGGAAPLDLTDVGGTVLDANSFVANIGRGRASAVVHALEQQGDVRTVSQPRLRALNNQTAFIKVGEDRPFFRLQQTTTLNQPGTTTPFNQTQENYSVTTITIGTILAVTPQIGADRIVTLDVLPAITRLQTIVTSPDGKQTAPVTEVKQASTIVRLRDGETVIIGGLISEDNGQTTRAIPVLGRIPVLGQAFRSQAKLRNRTELVIFLTPHLSP